METSLANPEAEALTSYHETPENSGADRADTAVPYLIKADCLIRLMPESTAPCKARLIETTIVRKPGQ